MASVFVSYAREDSAKAQSLAAALEASGVDVWFDQRIESGSEYSLEIEAALARASAVLVLWTKASVQSAWVRDEAAEGRDSGRLVSVLLDGCRPPIGFRQFQTVDLARWSGRGTPSQFADILRAVKAKSRASEIAARPAVPPPRRPRWLIWSVALVGVALLALGLFYLAESKRDGGAQLGLTLLPFTADASDSDARKIAAATHDAVAHTLSLGAFAISTPGTASPSPKTDYVISGQVTSAAGKLLMTVRMQETARNIVVFSHQFEAKRDQLANFPELVGAQVASQLSWTAPLLKMEQRHPSQPAIVAALLQSSSAGLESVGSLHDYETARRLARQAPDSPLAQNNLAFSTAFVLDHLPREQRAPAVAEARAAVDRAIRLAPEFGDNYTPWCLLRSEQRKVQCEDMLRKAMRTDPDSPFANWFLGFLVLNQVGRNEDAAQMASLSLAHDQYMPFKIGLVLRTKEATGQVADADDLYRRSQRWWPGNEAIASFRINGIMTRADFKALEQFDRERNPKGTANPVLVAINSGSLPAVRRACNDVQPGYDPILCMLAFGRLGDLDSAFAFADRIYPDRRGRSAAEEERIWLDRPSVTPMTFLTGTGAAAMRRDGRFIALAGRLGLLEYWRSGRPPDFCRQPAEPICRTLLARN